MSDTLHQVLTALLTAEEHVIAGIHEALLQKGIIKASSINNPNQLELPLAQ